MEQSSQTSGFNPQRRSRFIALLAGFLAGVLNAVVARLLMRGIALVEFGEGSFSWGGTAVIFGFGVLVGPLFGLIYGSTLYRLHAREVVKDCYLASSCSSRCNWLAFTSLRTSGQS